MAYNKMLFKNSINTLIIKLLYHHGVIQKEYRLMNIVY
jgi:hypothetical protein